MKLVADKTSKALKTYKTENDITQQAPSELNALMNQRLELVAGIRTTG
jgi:hypothetical protein